ncbi:MAG: hypothetical protein J1E56_01230 [Ruminococcus sp.]|nr:hypothetical protein [Ruminococcus sp.]
MAVISSLIKALTPLNIYNITYGTNIYNELYVYANELDRLNLEIDTLLREAFVYTAESYGLANIEKIYTAEDTSNTAQTRREKLLERLSINDSYFTLKDMKKSLLGLGVKDSRILEFPSRRTIVFEISGKYTDAEINFIKAEIKKLAPVAFEIQIYFGGLSWSDFEGKNLSFSSMDLQNLSWEQIDELE